jgi:hypothetical protein
MYVCSSDTFSVTGMISGKTLRQVISLVIFLIDIYKGSYQADVQCMFW